MKTVCVALLLIAGDIELNPGPPANTFNLQFGLLNINSVRCKAPLVHDIISDHNLDILALTETRLQADTPNAIKLDPAPPGYSIRHVHRVPTDGLASTRRGTRRHLQRQFSRVATILHHVAIIL